MVIVVMVALDPGLHPRQDKEGAVCLDLRIAAIFLTGSGSSWKWQWLEVAVAGANGREVPS